MNAKKDKHTPGPWELIFANSICIGIGAEVNCGVKGYSQIICNTILPDTDEQYEKEKEEILANARLIAAAPAMKRLLEMLVWRNRTQPDFDVSDIVEKAEQLLKQL